MAKGLADACRSLAWSQWSRLGVSASGVLAAETAIDLEAAIAFAPMLEELDPRLFTEALDWCVHYARLFTSVSCLKQVLRFFDPEHRTEFERFAATVNRHGSTRWPASNKSALPFTPTGKSRLRVDSAAAIQLRARKIFGINARADIISMLVLDQVRAMPRERLWVRISGLVDLAYSRRQLADALHDLHLGGVVSSIQSGTTQYALVKPDLLRELLAPLPLRPGQPWARRLALATSLLRAESKLRGKSEITRAVEVRKIVESHRPRLEQVEDAPPDVRAQSNPFHVVESWLVPLLHP